MLNSKSAGSIRAEIFVARLELGKSLLDPPLLSLLKRLLQKNEQNFQPIHASVFLVRRNAHSFVPTRELNTVGTLI